MRENKYHLYKMPGNYNILYCNNSVNSQEHLNGASSVKGTSYQVTTTNIAPFSQDHNQHNVKYGGCCLLLKIKP